MPFDSWGSSLENDISELEEYHKAVDAAIEVITADYFFTQLETLKKLSRDLQRQKERKKWELRTHRQRDKERGIKY